QRAPDGAAAAWRAARARATGDRGRGHGGRQGRVRPTSTDLSGDQEGRHGRYKARSRASFAADARAGNGGARREARRAERAATDVAVELHAPSYGAAHTAQAP